MNKTLILKLSAILLGFVALQGSQCLPIPSVEEKVVELTVGSTITIPVHATGYLGVHDDTEIVEIADSLDIAAILADAGIDAGDLIDLTMTGVAYRVTVPDPNPDREITSGNVTIQRGAGPIETVVSNFEETVNTVTDWKDATLDPTGVAVFNDVLGDLVEEANGGAPATNTTLTFHVTGNSTPSGDPEDSADFWWELRVYFSVVGVITLDFVTFD
ncbi:hypothetical protein ACFL6M_07345 [Candidatus Eisenbacteria bacterium]|uniref:Uncharacterized protein n=1 Tax=Eiseniibacteriota bacterium TaxID=2212470 RepID=A0ABV6YM38_UNCEI